jgi:DNA gyrase subunit B
MQDYDDSEIRVFKSLREAICHRPGMYLGGSLDSEAFHRLVLGIIENAISAEAANQATHVCLTIQGDNWFSIADNGRGIPVDIDYGWIYQAFYPVRGTDRFEQLMQKFDRGQRIPPEVQNNPNVTIQPIIEVTLSRVFTGAATPERFSYFGHLYYEGAVLTALSREFKVTTYSGGNQYAIAFTHGKLTQPLKLVGSSSEVGTRVDFQPEPSLFDGLFFSMEKINGEIRRLSAKYKGKKFTIVDETSNAEWSFN